MGRCCGRLSTRSARSTSRRLNPTQLHSPLPPAGPTQTTPQTPPRMSPTDSSLSFPKTDTRADDMRSTLSRWIDDLTDDIAEARTSRQFIEWLDAQSRFHDYSARNALLIRLQCPEATRVAGYQTWQSEFNRYVKKGEQAIWIWSPIITTKCPECGNSPRYHKRSECDYGDTPPEEWSEGLVGFQPTSVFDVSQTEGEPLPQLNTEAVGDADDLVPQLRAAATPLGIDVRVSDPSDWNHGDATGVCLYDHPHSQEDSPLVKVKARSEQAALAGTLIHEYAHALLHSDREPERSKREVEAEAVAYLVGRCFNLDMSRSAVYIAAWEGDDPDQLHTRLNRINSTAQDIINAIQQ